MLFNAHSLLSVILVYRIELGNYENGSLTLTQCSIVCF